MSTKTKLLGLMTAFMVLSVPMVWADNGDWHHGQQDEMMTKILNLTQDQEKQLKDSRQKHKEAMKAVMEQMKSNREAFDAEIIKATPDMNKINDIQTQMKTIQSQMLDNHLNSIMEIKKILSPEQFAGFMALEKQEQMMKHEHHKGMMGKDGGEHKHWGDKDQDND